MAYAEFFNGGGSVTSHRDDVKYYVILRHYNVTSLAVCQFRFLTFMIIFHQTGRLYRSVTDVAIDAEDFGFNSQAGQIRHSVTNGSPSLRRFFGPKTRSRTPPLAIMFRYCSEFNETSTVKI